MLFLLFTNSRFLPLIMSNRVYDEQALQPAHFSYALGDILNCYTFSCVCGVVITIVRDLNNTHKFVVDHDSLGAVLAGTFRFVHINVVNQFPE